MKTRATNIQRVIAFLVIAIVTVYLSPKELIHQFIHHEETADVICTDTCADHVGSEHQHCEILQLSIPPVSIHINQFSFFEYCISSDVVQSETTGYKHSTSDFLFFRGPPSQA